MWVCEVLYLLVLGEANIIGRGIGRGVISYKLRPNRGRGFGSCIFFKTSYVLSSNLRLDYRVYNYF